MPKCDGDWKNPGCNREAICVERDMDSKKILRYVCQGHAHSFNPYTEFAVLELKRRAVEQRAVAEIAVIEEREMLPSVVICPDFEAVV